MSPLANLPVLIMIFMVLVLALLMLYFGTRRYRQSRMRPDLQAKVADAKIESGEQVASLVAEEIEELVRAKLAAYPDLAGTDLDFGTLPDGSIDIRINGTQYREVDSIPDSRVRDAIRAAVATFNR
jgi:hypothetical protein